jgi:hypothetical protein
LNTVSYNGALNDSMFQVKATYEPGALPGKK